MPIYEYVCLDCETEFERFHKVIERAQDVSCPSCYSNRVKKQISLTVYPAWSNFLDRTAQTIKKKPWDDQ